jgi:hypothetical protein
METAISVPLFKVASKNDGTSLLSCSAHDENFSRWNTHSNQFFTVDFNIDSIQLGAFKTLAKYSGYRFPPAYFCLVWIVNSSNITSLECFASIIFFKISVVP